GSVGVDVEGGAGAVGDSGAAQGVVEAGGGGGGGVDEVARVQGGVAEGHAPLGRQAAAGRAAQRAAVPGERAGDHEVRRAGQVAVVEGEAGQGEQAGGGAEIHRAVVVHRDAADLRGRPVEGDAAAAAARGVDRQVTHPRGGRPGGEGHRG